MRKTDKCTRTAKKDMGLENLTVTKGKAVCEDLQHFTTYSGEMRITVSVVLRRDPKQIPTWRRLDVLLQATPGRDGFKTGEHAISVLYDFDEGHISGLHTSVKNVSARYLPKLLPAILEYLPRREQYYSPFIPALYAACEKVSETPN